jgi:hypothetical protein
LYALTGAVFVAVMGIMPANAQATRTWVSGVGDDVNPCSRTAPCKTFAGAISKTATGGTINCIDPGGFGGVTITKSITLDCTGTLGSILASGTNAVIVNGAGAIVHLRNISIEGAGTGLAGVHFINGAALTIEKCQITGFNAGQASGINFVPTTNAELYVADTSIASNGVPGTGAGIRIRPTGAANVSAVFKNVDIAANATGVATRGDGGTGFIRVSLVDSVVQGSGSIGITAASQAGQAFTRIFLKNMLVTNNGTDGLSVDGGQAAALVDQSTVFSNNVGLAVLNGGQIFSYVTNSINGNITTDGAPSGTLPLR